MTKLKSKKMTKSTFAVIIMAIAMVAMLAFGGTYAYFTASTSPVTNDSLTTAKVQLGAPSITTINAETKVLPTMPVLDTDGIAISNDSDTEVYIFVTLSAKAQKNSSDVTFKDKQGSTIANPFEIEYSKTGNTQNFEALTGVKNVTGVYYVKTSAESVKLADQITLSSAIHSNSTETTEGDVMSATVIITVTAQAIQSYNLATAADAYIALNGGEKAGA